MEAVKRAFSDLVPVLVIVLVYGMALGVAYAVGRHHGMDEGRRQATGARPGDDEL